MSVSPDGSGRSVRILMVDDEPNILAAYRRSLRGQFSVVTAGSGAEALAVMTKTLAAGYAFPVIVSDMKMPEMDGAQFLAAAREVLPDAVQMLLSGQADLESTIAAVNDGNLFRFLTKPCDTEDLELALTAALDQHRLVRAERDLLETTLGGAVDVLVQVLAMASPEAFARTQQVRHLVTTMAKTLSIKDWRLPLAAMLSQVGCVAVPPDVLHRARNGGFLDDDETEVYLGHPRAAQQLLERIPRLEEVAAWIGDQPVRVPGTDVMQTPGSNLAAAGSDPVPVPAPRNPSPSKTTGGPVSELIGPDLLLRAALDFLSCRDALSDPRAALHRLGESGDYPTVLMTALTRAAVSLAPPTVLAELTVEQVTVGMVLDADIETLGGMLLVHKGETVTEVVAMRLANFARTAGIKEPIRCWTTPESARTR